MRLNDIIYKFLRNPLPLWEAEATIAIIQYKWKELKQTKMLGISDYSTARAYYDCTVPIDGKYYLADFNSNDSMCIESYSASLQGFYNEHGLNLYSDSELKSKQYIKRIESALEIFNLVMPVKICISKLVRTIQVLKQEDMEIDVSYSHPQIPFSIFVSVCDENSVISNLRVAESILHEAMHLKLTLIENVLPLVKTDTGNLFFSPWRDEKRPAQGILHGIFVFSAVHDFYNTLIPLYNAPEVIKYLNFRIEEIESEIKLLGDFSKNSDLTSAGKNLAKHFTRY